MAQVQFPSGPADGATYTVNDVTYTWSATNSLWTANNSTDLNSLFVAVAGDTMTGDLVANTTGALTIPTGTEAEKPGAPLAGATRLNTTSGFTEIYTGSRWKSLEYTGEPGTLPANLTISANTTLTDPTFVVNDLTIAAGVTVTLETQSVVFVCYGEVDISGTIEASEKGGPGGAVQLAGIATTVSNPVAGSGLGASVISPLGGIARSYQPLASPIGSGGSSGVGAPANGLIDTAGGYGGGGILIMSHKNIVVSGNLNTNGGDALSVYSNGNVWCSGSGGGSGGSVVLHAKQNITFTGTISANGGNGIPGTIVGVPGVSNLNGGGGGGGGYAILQADNTLVNTGTMSLNGGLAGALIGVADSIGGGNGGSFGGAGGLAAFDPNGAADGSPGIFATSGSPI